MAMDAGRPACDSNRHPACPANTNCDHNSAMIATSTIRKRRRRLDRLILNGTLRVLCQTILTSINCSMFKDLHRSRD